MKLKALLFIISFFCIHFLHAQFIRVEGIRVGFDPVRSISFLFQENEKNNHLFYLNTLEGNLEVLCFGRVSVVSEFGYSKIHITKSFGEFDYFSRGKYVRLGLDFDLSDEEERVQTFIGWRFGVNSYNEQANLIFRNNYFNSEFKKDYVLRTKSIMWGEILFAAKYKINKSTPSGLFLGASLRLKFANALKNDFPSVIVPGYGYYHNMTAGVNFSLFYHFKTEKNNYKGMKYKKNRIGS